MTLTNALNLALDPATKEEGVKALNTIARLDEDGHVSARPERRRRLSAGLLLWMLGAAPELGDYAPAAIYALHHAGADLSGAKVTNGQPDWSVTMPRLATWADSLEVTP